MHRIGRESFFVEEVLVAVEQNAELGAPVPEVIVGDDLVPQETQQSGERIAEDGAPQMADVHRLGDVGGAEVDDERLRPGYGRDAEAVAACHPLDLGGQPVFPQAQVDEPGACDLRRLEHAGEVQFSHDLLSDFGRFAAQYLGQRHRTVGLVVAVAWILRRLDHRRVGGHVGHHPRERVTELFLQQLKDVHEPVILPSRTLSTGLPTPRVCRTPVHSMRRNDPPACEWRKRKGRSALNAAVRPGPTASDPLPVDAPGVGPEVLDGEILPGRGIEDVDHHVAVVLDDPLTGCVAFDRKALVALSVHGRVDLFGDGVDLPAAVAGGQDEEIVKGSEAAHVEDDDVPRFVVGRYASTVAGSLERGNGLQQLGRSFRCGRQETSFRCCDRVKEVSRNRRTRDGFFVVAVGHLQAGSTRPAHDEPTPVSPQAYSGARPSRAGTTLLSYHPPPRGSRQAVRRCRRRLSGGKTRRFPRSATGVAIQPSTVRHCGLWIRQARADGVRLRLPGGYFCTGSAKGPPL